MWDLVCEWWLTAQASGLATVLIPLAVLCWGLLLVLAQWRWPLRQRQAYWLSVWSRVLLNVSIAAAAFVIAALIVKPAIIWAMGSDWLAGGALGWLTWPYWLESILAIAALDWSFYYWHRLNHEVPWLWRFHNVHHCDPELDVTTGFRFHPAEVGLSAGFRVVQVLVIGVDPVLLAAYEVVFQFSVLFHHSNWSLPQWLERCLQGVVITPQLHGSHHSQQQQEANANYGVVFSCWDRLHRSLVVVDNRRLRLGVPAYSQQHDQAWWALLRMPFARQRNYWQSPSGDAAVVASTEGESAVQDRALRAGPDSDFDSDFDPDFDPDLHSAPGSVGGQAPESHHNSNNKTDAPPNA